MMDITTLISLALIGVISGIASGYIGIGGGIIIIPALIYFLKLDQYQAQGSFSCFNVAPDWDFSFLQLLSKRDIQFNDWMVLIIKIYLFIML